MIFVAALIVLAYIVVMAFAPAVLAVCAVAAAVAAEGDRQTVYEPLAAVRSGEGGHAEGKDAPQGCGPREARQNASSVASRAGTGATTQPDATGREGTPGPGSLRDSTLNAKLARPDRGRAAILSVLAALSSAARAFRMDALRDVEGGPAA